MTVHRLADTHKGGSGFYPTAWLIIANNGWTTAEQVFSRMPLRLIELDLAKVQSLLWLMAHRQNLLRSRGDRTNREYAVLTGCDVPNDVTVGQVLDAMKAGE